MHDEGNNEEEKENLHVSTQHVDKNDRLGPDSKGPMLPLLHSQFAEVLTGMKQSEKTEMLDTTANFGQQKRKQDHLLKRIQSMPRQ